MQRESQRPKKEGPGGPATPSETQQQQQQQEAASAAPDPARIWLPELVQRYARSLPCNEDRTVRLSQPVPRHAFVWRWGDVGAMRSFTRRQWSRLMCLTAGSGSIANLEVLLARNDGACELSNAVMSAAAGAGQLEVCRWLRQRGCPWDSFTLGAAAEGGHQDVCEWLLASGCPWSVWAAGRAARGGHVGLMDWLLLLRTGRPAGRVGCLIDLLSSVAAGCDLPTLQRLHSMNLLYAHSQLDEHCRDCVMAAAAGSLTADWRAKVEWLEGQGFPRTAKACVEAVKQPDWRGRLQWLQQRGYPLDTYAAAEAAAVGAVDALQLMLDSGVALGYPQVEYVCGRRGCRGGHLAVLQMLHARGFNIAERANAAQPLHVPVLAWLLETLGASKVLSVRLFRAAAEFGIMELMAWLYEQGCPWDESVFAAAAQAGCEAQLEWLAALGCPMGEEGEPYMRALRTGNLATLRCLQRLGCPWGPVLRSGAAQEAAAGQGARNEELRAWVQQQRQQHQLPTGDPRGGAGAGSSRRL
ncbi:hypothetical protein TSOC_009887 [Tetrabaena socialis]|uniref:Ankyrin repeat domain-containing protein n=1 Tax=Tetrabaena socialis TaxID=47790 RepID=A0A2J7ZUN0_9CHLO|nr:hypothetical protein TSOC_009887 [Tetrabaena socialis]|eukprot:PNH03987.1 hypothetical protein TSOC_009887 [Tetrabaena socialis]